MKKIHEVTNSGVIVAKLTNLVDGAFAFNEVAIAAVKQYAQEELNIELDRIILRTNIDCDLLTKKSQPTGSHSANSDHHLEIFKTNEDKYIAELSLLETIRIEQL